MSAGRQSQCGTEPCPGCYVDVERKGKGKTYSFRNCPGPSDAICAEQREDMHLMGDHRLCDDDKSVIRCAFARRWFRRVRKAGIEACERDDRDYAIVSVRTGQVVVHRTHVRLSTAKPHRTALGRKGDDRFAAKKDHFVVCRWGHLH